MCISFNHIFLNRSSHTIVFNDTFLFSNISRERERGHHAYCTPHAYCLSYDGVSALTKLPQSDSHTVHTIVHSSAQSLVPGAPVVFISLRSTTESLLHIQHRTSLDGLPSVTLCIHHLSSSSRYVLPFSTTVYATRDTMIE